MSWLARSIANSLKLDDDKDDTDTPPNDNTDHPKNDTAQSDHLQQQQQPQSPSTTSPSSTTNATTPRGVKEDLSELTKTLSRQFWGVASFLAPPSPLDGASSPRQISDDGPNDHDNEDLIAGIRSDFAEIGGKVRSGISKLSENKAVFGFTKIASNLLQFGSERGDDDDVDAEGLVGSVVGVTEEVVAFARDLAVHPETWLDFPVPHDGDFDDFDLTDAQQEHALAVEQLAPRLSALRMELCPGYMSEQCFWKIYFVLLHPKLSKEDALLLSTPEVMEARATLSHELQKRAKARPAQALAGTGSSTSTDTASMPREESLSVPPKTSEIEVSSPPVAANTSDSGTATSSVVSELETEKRAVQSVEAHVVDKAVVEEEPVHQTRNEKSSSVSATVQDDKHEDDGDDWLKEESSETVGASGMAAVSFGDDEDVSFSDLEDDDSDVPVSYKKVTSGSDSSMKDSKDWVQLSNSSGGGVKDIKPISTKRAATGQVSAQISESTDWLDVEDIDDV